MFVVDLKSRSLNSDMVELFLYRVKPFKAGFSSLFASFGFLLLAVGNGVPVLAIAGSSHTGSLRTFDLGAMVEAVPLVDTGVGALVDLGALVGTGALVEAGTLSWYRSRSRTNS